jgi:hypothetical protein
MRLNKFYDFMQILNSIRNHPTKNGHFPMHNLFSIIYLLQEHKLNHNKYSEQELNINFFAQDIDHDVHMYANFRDLNFHGFL